MYTPSHFAFNDRAGLLEFMRRYNFATVVSQVEGVPFASHLPVAVEENEAGEVLLLAHFAKNNPQWQTLAEQTALVIFNEPHAYVSPSLYEKTQNVPTWNYLAVHAYGRVRLISDDAEAFALLEKQMAFFEKAYLTQWSTLDAGYKNALVRGIVAFEMTVERLEGKQKLSQNKSEHDQQTVTAHLLDSADTVAREVGERMQQLYGK